MKYPELKWIVFEQYRSESFWEAIAAFKNLASAEFYKLRQERVNSDFFNYKIEEIADA